MLHAALLTSSFQSFDLGPNLMHLFVSSLNFRLWLCSSSWVVRRTSGQNHPALRCPQAGHLWWVLRGDQGPEKPWGQDACGSEQSWPDQHPAADEGVWCPHVVTGEDHKHPWGGPSVYRLILGSATSDRREQEAVWSGGEGPLQRYSKSSQECCPTEAQWSD